MSVHHRFLQACRSAKLVLEGVRQYLAQGLQIGGGSIGSKYHRDSQSDQSRAAMWPAI